MAEARHKQAKAGYNYAQNGNAISLFGGKALNIVLKPVRQTAHAKIREGKIAIISERIKDVEEIFILNHKGLFKYQTGEESPGLIQKSISNGKNHAYDGKIKKYSESCIVGGLQKREKNV